MTRDVYYDGVKVGNEKFGDIYAGDYKNVGSIDNDGNIKDHGGRQMGGTIWSDYGKIEIDDDTFSSSWEIKEAYNSACKEREAKQKADQIAKEEADKIDREEAQYRRDRENYLADRAPISDSNYFDFGVFVMVVFKVLFALIFIDVILSLLGILDWPFCMFIINVLGGILQFVTNIFT